MPSHIEESLSAMQAKLRLQEEEVKRTKTAINAFCELMGMPKMYHDLELQQPGDLSAIRSDQFYGQPLSSAVRTYLEMRKASGLGAATVSEIYAALNAGGYKFETKDADNAKRVLRISLTKNSSVFHKLPNGQYGLLAWYPAAKEAKRSEPTGSQNTDIGADASEGNNLDSQLQDRSAKRAPT